MGFGGRGHCRTSTQPIGMRQCVPTLVANELRLSIEGNEPAISAEEVVGQINAANASLP
jgi:hypothetical protein